MNSLANSDASVVDRLEKITGARLPFVLGDIRVLDQPAVGNPAWQGNSPASGTSLAPWPVYNICNNQPVELMEYIAILEKALGKTAEKQLLPLHAGDVPDTKVDEGIQLFVAWYRNEFKFI